jgi:antitoxin (DNA-binding transcriptional repressor) of toxin-antitoxin stability system
MNVAIREAKNNFSRYGNLAHAGNRVTVCKNGKPWFDLVPHETRPRSVEPIAKPTLSESQATASVEAHDIEGWL